MKKTQSYSLILFFKFKTKIFECIYIYIYIYINKNKKPMWDEIKEKDNDFMRHLNRGHQRYLHFCYERLEDPYPSAHSLKFRYKNLEDKQKYIAFSLFKKIPID